MITEQITTDREQKKTKTNNYLFRKSSSIISKLTICIIQFVIKSCQSVIDRLGVRDSQEN